MKKYVSFAVDPLPAFLEIVKCFIVKASLSDIEHHMIPLCQVSRAGPLVSLLVDSSLAKLDTVGQQPLKLDGILFLGREQQAGIQPERAYTLSCFVKILA